MSRKVLSNPRTLENTEIITVYGIQEVRSFIKRECVVSTVDEGDSCLLEVDIHGRHYFVRVLKEDSSVGFVIDVKKGEKECAN